MKKRQDKQINLRAPGRERLNHGAHAPGAWYGRDDVSRETGSALMDPPDELLIAVSRETAELPQLLGPALRLPAHGQALVRQQMAIAAAWYAERRRIRQLIIGDRHENA